MSGMTLMTFGQLVRRIGLRPSAIRFYEARSMATLASGRLGVRVRRLSLDRIFLAKKRHRLAVPQLALKS